MIHKKTVKVFYFPGMIRILQPFPLIKVENACKIIITYTGTKDIICLFKLTQSKVVSYNRFSINPKNTQILSMWLSCDGHVIYLHSLWHDLLRCFPILEDPPPVNGLESQRLKHHIRQGVLNVYGGLDNTITFTMVAMVLTYFRQSYKSNIASFPVTKD